MKSIVSSPAALCLTTIAALLSLPAQAQYHWSGQGSSLSWTDTGNWFEGAVPGSTDTAYLEDSVVTTGWTNAAGLINSIVDTSLPVGALEFTALSAALTNHFYTTLVPAGTTFTVGGVGSGLPVLAAGDVPGSGVWLNSGTWTNYSTITGPGHLVVNDSAGLVSVGMRNRATLDLTGLANFNAGIQQLLVGASPDNPNSTGPVGWLLLAKTNKLTTTANPSAPGVILASANNGNNSAFVGLGGVNTFNTDGLVVAGRRASSTLLAFGPAYSNTISPGVFTLRGSAGGASRVGTFSIGDMAAEPNDFQGSPAGSSTGTADLTGGSVDIRADSIYVGRSAADTGTGGSFTYGFGNLIVEHGTVDVNNLYIAYKQGTNASSSLNGSSTALPCTVTIKSNAQVTVNQDVTIAFRNNGTNGSQIPFGALVVNDSATVNIGGNVTTPTNGISTLQLGGGTINMTAGGSLTNTTLTGAGSIAGANNIIVVSNLAPGGVSTPGTLNLGGNLGLLNPFPLTFDLGPNATIGGGVNDYVSVAGNVSFNNNPLSFTFNGPLIAGSTYHLVDFTGSRSGSITFTNLTRSDIGVDQTTPGHLDLVVTNWMPATLTWVGNANGNSTNNVWNMTDTNWNNSGNSDRFFAMDDVVFDDTAAGTTIFPNGALYPNSVTINGTKSFALTNRSSVGPPWVGSINGACSLTKNGTGSFLLGCYSNTFTGPIYVNNGILKPFDATFTTPGNNPVLGATSGIMYVTNAGTFDVNGIGSISSGKPIVIKGSGFNGIGAITNGVSNSGATLNGYFVTLAGDATVSADVGGWGLRGLASSGAFYSGLLNLNGFTLTKLGAARLSLQDVLATSAGSINFGGGNLSLQNSVLTGAGTLTFSNNTYVMFPFLAGATSYVAKAISTTGNFGVLTPSSGSAVSQVLVDSTIGLGGPLSVTNNQTLIFGGVISGPNSLTKYGNSNLVLNAANTYNGPTTVTAGTLALGAGGSIASSPSVVIAPGASLDTSAKAGTFALAPGQTLNMNGSVIGDLTVAAGSTLLGAGTISGSLTINSNAEVALATTNVTGTMIVSSNLSLAGGHFTWELAPSFDISDAFIVNGNLHLTGTNVFTVNSIGGFDPSGTNTLITYAGTLTGGLSNLLVNSSARFVVALVDPATTPGKIQIRLVTPSPNLVWKGGAVANPTRWDVKTTANWDNSGTPDVFWSSDIVAFDDTAVTNVVNLVGTLGPASITFNNSSANYFLGGSGGLVAASLTNNGAASVTLTNTANTFFTGDGLILNTGTITFSQPTNALLAANLVGPGTFVKAGLSNLVLTGSALNFNGTINVNNGQLRAGSSNAVASWVNVASGATLDVNGQSLPSANVTVLGVGSDGFGALNNKGIARTNSLTSVTLAGATTFGALSNAWGITGEFAGAGFALTKTNANDVWIQTGGETDLGDIEVRQGRLAFAVAGTTLGRPTNTVTLRPGATLALAATNAMPQSGLGLPGMDAGAKPVVMQNGSVFESVGFPVNQSTTNTHSGPIALNTNGVFKVGVNSILALNGPISGNSALTLTNGGTLYLGGTNTYASNTFVYSGTLVLNNSNSLPPTGTLAVSNLISSFGNAGVDFENDSVFTNTTVMRLSSLNGQVTVSGNGIWNGPILMYGSNNYNFSGGTDLLNLAGPLVTTNAGGTVLFHGSNTRVAGALAVNGPVTIGVGDGLGAGYDERFTTVTFGKSNTWTTTTIDRGRVNLATNNVIPPTSAIRVGTLSAGVSDRRIIFDLGGYNQIISSLTETAVGDSLVLFGNSSTNSDSILTYAGISTNTWGGTIVDDLDFPATPHTTGLTVTSGVLNLLATNTYTGPTLISGGTLNLNLGSGLTAGWVGQIADSLVTVNGTGTLGGNGIIAGPVTINSGGTLSPGNSIGQLTIYNSLTLNPGGRCVFEVNLATGTNDNIVGISALTYGGTLVITNVGATPFTNGTILKLFDALNYTAGAVTIKPGAPAPGLMWDASNLPVDGTLAVVPAVAPIVSDIARLPDGNFHLTISGGIGQGYTVLGATNVALPIGNWTVLQSGSLPSTSYSYDDLAATNYPQRFYRVSTP